MVKRVETQQQKILTNNKNNVIKLLKLKYIMRQLCFKPSSVQKYFRVDDNKRLKKNLCGRSVRPQDLVEVYKY